MRLRKTFNKVGKCKNNASLLCQTKDKNMAIHKRKYEETIQITMFNK